MGFVGKELKGRQKRVEGLEREQRGKRGMVSAGLEGDFLLRIIYLRSR